MKYQISIVIAILLLLLIPVSMADYPSLQQDQVVDPDDYMVKILTYNVYRSGENPEFIDVLKEENGDILLLVETGDWDDNDNQQLNQITDELNNYFVDEEPYEAYTDQGAGFYTTGNAILSRFPLSDITEVFNLALDNGDEWYATHDLVVATADVFGMEIVVSSTHLKCCSGDSNEIRRENEQEGFNNYFDTISSSMPLIYGGDLNSYAPGEGTVLGTEPIAMIIDETHPKTTVNHNFTDSFRELNPGDDGDTFKSGGRIDYIFVNQHLNQYMVNSTVGDTTSADAGSDHFSVDLFLDLTHLIPEPTASISSDERETNFIPLLAVTVVLIITNVVYQRNYLL